MCCNSLISEYYRLPDMKLIGTQTQHAEAMAALEQRVPSIYLGKAIYLRSIFFHHICCTCLPTYLPAICVHSSRALISDQSSPRLGVARLGAFFSHTLYHYFHFEWIIFRIGSRCVSANVLYRFLSPHFWKGTMFFVLATKATFSFMDLF